MGNRVGFLVILAFFGTLAYGEHLPPPMDGKRAAQKASETVSACMVPPSVQKALVLKRQVETSNTWELGFLSKRLEGRLAKLSQAEETGLVRLVRARLAEDRKTFAAIQTALAKLPQSERGSVELRTSLNKLVGSEKQSGILADASALLEGDRFPRNLLEPAPRHNRITVIKTLLLYANVAADGAQNLDALARCDEWGRMQLLYPAEIPKGIDADTAERISLVCNFPRPKTLMIPNAGFIFGGTFQNGVCRGVDCSAFLSHCTDSSVRLSTMVMEYTWREAKDGVKAFNEKERAIRNEFLDKWGMREALREYEAIAPEPALLRPGDLVIWRWTGANDVRQGHVVLVLETGPHAGEFSGIEANRDDDKSKEGILVGSFSLSRTNAETYVLRRR